MSKLFDLLNRGKAPLEQRPPTLETKTAGRPFPKAEAPVAVEVAPEQASSSSLATVRTLGIHPQEASPLLPFGKGQWRPSEQYRILRTKIGQHPKKPRLIVISSPAPGDGKSVSAINTAGALSLKSEGQVLLMDADFRKSAIHVQLGIPESPGLAEVLNGTCTLEDAVVQVQRFPNLFVLPAGSPPTNPVELLDSPAWQNLCASLRSPFRYVVVDSPPVGAVADYDLIQAVCDGVIVVVRPDHTNRRLCQKALENIPKPKFLGVLMNCVPDWKPARHAGTDYYYYSSEYTDNGPTARNTTTPV
jgi:capsular exopolysaccharide synthesis family protein